MSVSKISSMKVDKNVIIRLLKELEKLQEVVNPFERHVDGPHIEKHLEAEKIANEILGCYGLPSTHENGYIVFEIKRKGIDFILSELEETAQDYLSSNPNSITELLNQVKFYTFE